MVLYCKGTNARGMQQNPSIHWHAADISHMPIHYIRDVRATTFMTRFGFQ